MTKAPYNPGDGFSRPKNGGYGPRTNSDGKTEFHGGVDYSAAEGTDIHAATAGTVVYSGFNNTYGNVVVVQATDGYYTLYAHLQNGSLIPRDTKVKQNDTIGKVGNTGLSDGAHLHFEVLDKRVVITNPDGGSIGFKSSNPDIRYNPDKFEFENNLKDIEITISDATANEKEGTITFTININTTKPLDEDFTFNVSTIDGSATGNLDYMSVLNAPVTIKAGAKQTTYSIPYSIAIASDGIYERSEDFMLYANYKEGTYTGSDLGKVKGGTGVGTITDDLVSGCPVVVQPDFGLNFTAPTPMVSAVYGGGSGGGVSYYGGSSGGNYTPSVYTGTSTPAPVVLPNLPVYECHYDVTLFSVAIVSLPVACQPSTPPLVFDLNHDGITSLSMAASLALFDYNADTIKEHTAWIQNGDALLVNDTNNDGLINNGAELFGDHTLKHDGTTASDGYDALRDYDTNNDGIIDANDEHFNDLKLWRDNGDGITQTTELKTLTEEGITSITLPNTTPTPITENGNTITNTSTYTQTDGTTGSLKDVWFSYENIATETYFDTDGDGFSEKMESWMNANQGVLVWDKNKDGKINSGKEILGTNMLLPNGKTANDSYSALNAFDTNHDGIIDTNDTAGLAIWKDTNKNGQTDEGELLQIGEENSLTSINLNPFQNMLSGYDRNHDMKINSSDAIYNYMYEQENADGTISLYLPNNADAKAMLGSYTGGESMQTSQGVKPIKEVIFYDGELPLNNTINGTAQNDKLIGNRRSNVLYGNDGRDILDAKEGNDTLEGGRGDDYLLGGAGDDTYVFKKGDGVDLIEDSGGKDTLKFKEGITQEDLILSQSGNDLIIGIKEGTKKFNELSDKVVLSNWFETDRKIETLLDANGSDINIEAIDKENVSTLISVSETFENGAIGWTNNTTTTASELTQFLGRFSGTGGQEGVSKSYDFGIENAGKKVTIEFDMYKIDSWDGEEFDIFINSQKILNVLPVSDAYTSQNIFTDWGSEKMSHYSLQATIGEDGKLQLGFGSTLNQSISDESWGIDNIAIHTEEMDSQVLQLNGGQDQLSTTPIVTSAKTGDQVSVSFEMTWNGNNSSMPIGFYSYDLWFTDGTFGFNTGVGDIYGISNTKFLIGTTHTITAIFTQGNVTSNQLYIDGVQQTLSQVLGKPNNAVADITKELNIGPWDINSGYGFQGTMDNIQLHNRALSTAEISLIAQKKVISDGLVAHYDFDGAIPYADKSGTGHTATASGNVVVINDLSSTHTPENVIDSNDYKNITADNELWVDNIKTLTESGLTELVLQTGYTGFGTSGTTAQTTTQGAGYSGTLQNNWFKSNALDTKYVFEGEVSADIQALPNIKGQGAIRDMQHVMAENPTLTQSVSAYKAQTSTASFSDLDSQMNDILAQWVQLDNYGGISQATPPIVLDLNGNGITSTSLDGSDAYFDYDGNGRRELTAWSEKDDALLAVDRNNDGVINNGSELFGTYSKLADGSNASDGYIALSAYDSNNDKVIDVNDAKFNDLRLWQDANQNGKSEAGELKTLTEMGVTSLSLNGSSAISQENGNTISGETTFSTATGTTGVMRDVWFNYSDKHSIAVSNLSDADEKKLAIVEAFLGKKLTASDIANPYIITAAFEQYNTLKYDAMAKMFSNELFGKNFTACRFMYEALNNTLARIISGDSNETEMALAANLAAAALKRNSTNALAELNHAYLESDVISNLLEQRDVVINLSDGVDISGNIGSNYYGTQNGETLDYSAQKDGVVVEAKGGNDIILGSQGRDVLYGGSGNDIIRGNGGVDILSGRQGNDLLIGGNEQSVYEYYLGDGDDIILDQGGKNDILRFAYLKPSDLKIEKSGDDMIIYVKSPDGNFDDPFGSITIKNGYTTGKIEQFYFDSKILSFDDLTVQTMSDTSYAYNKGDSKLVIEDTGGNDKLVFGNGITFDNIITKQVVNDLIIALKFEERPFAELPDQLTIKNFFNEQNRIESFVFQNGMILNHETIISMFDGTTMDSILWGDAQNNALVGTDGNDIFNAGAGNDTMEGKGGDDNYIFGKGSGKDIILDSSGIDTLSLGLGITRADIITKVIGDDIILGLKEVGKSFEELSDTVTIKNWAQTGFEIEKAVFDDGTALALDDLRNQAPVVTDTQVSITLQDLRQSTGTIAVTDPDGDVLNFMVTTAPTHGTLSVDDKGTWVYNANAGYVGSDSVIVSIDDGNGGVVEQTLNFTLAVSAPSITTNSLSLLEDTPLSNLLDVSNPVGGTLTYEIVNATTHGAFTLNNDGSYSYNPSSNYNGVDSVTLKVTNEYGLSTTQTIALDITPINDAPIVTEGTVSLTLHDIRNASGHVQSSDIDGDTLRYSTSTNPNHGTLTVDSATGQWSYSAVKGYMGADSAIIKVDDGNGGVVEQTLNFTLEVSAPTINTTALNLLEDNSYSNALSVTNPIGGALTYSIVDATDHGNFVLNSDGTYSYTPSFNYNGADSLSIKVTNEYGLSTIQTIALNITPVNDIPTFASNDDESYLLKNTRIVTGTLNASDVDGDKLTYTLTSNPTHGTLTLNSTTGVWSYESLFGYTGSDHATMSVSDGKGGVISKNMIFNAKGLVYEGGNIIIPAQTIGDKLDLGSIGMDALSFTKNGNNLAISVKDQGVITISDYFTQPNQALKTLSTSWGEINIGKEAIKQASGTWWWPFGSATANNGVDSLLIGSNYSDTLTGASGNDILLGSSNNDRLIGNAGNDLLLGGSGNDILVGSSGKDTLYGDSGNDTLDAKEGDDNLLGGIGSDSLYAGSGADKLSGGAGSDYLQGGIGNDTYYFNVGDGKDVIEDTTFSFCSWNTPEGGNDTIVFGKGIEKEDVTFLMQCGNLSIKYGDKESVVISGQNNDASAINRFELSDGSYLSSNDVESIIHQMSAYAKDHGIYISSNSNIENNQALMQIVSSGWHNA